MGRGACCRRGGGRTSGHSRAAFVGAVTAQGEVAVGAFAPSFGVRFAHLGVQGPGDQVTGDGDLLTPLLMLPESRVMGAETGRWL